MKLSFAMLRRASFSASLSLFLGLSGCTGSYKRSVLLDLTQGRLTNLSLSEKATGQREFVLFSVPRHGVYLEGYITGMVTDYGGNPIPGVIVRAALTNATGAVENVQSAAAAAGQVVPSREELAGGPFDAGISDSQGIYRVRFSLPIVDGKI